MRTKAVLLMMLVLANTPTLAQAKSWTDEQIADAIFKAEGGSKAKVPYGILSVKVKSKAEARQVCLNTIRNNRKRFARQTKYKDFISFLASRYCPVNCENDNGTNKFWVKNVRRFLK